MLLRLLFCAMLTFVLIGTSHADNQRFEPSIEKQTKCENLVKRYGGRSFDFNRRWYGKGVARPSPANWYLARIKEPWLFSRELMYVYEQKTSDGFIHRAVCVWTIDFFKVYVNAFDYGGVLVYPG